MAGSISLAVWLYLLICRGHFWLCAEQDDNLAPNCELAGRWPSVIAVVPARNEADGIEQSIHSLLQQRYPARFTILLVDDQSTDCTAARAEAVASHAGGGDRLTVIRGTDLPPAWTGKVWAMQQGLAYAGLQADPPDFVLFTDADIVHAPDVLKRLVAAACAREAVLISLMAKLRCESLAERISIPAFVFFFQKLFPFAWVNDPARRTAAAAGGCMLVRRDPLLRAGGLAAIRDALIDDCALAMLMKGQGPIWLGLTEKIRSHRAYPALGDIRRMVARSAYAQLRYSPLRLAATLAAMALVYLTPPLTALCTVGAARWVGVAAWALMAFAFQPTLRLYALRPIWSLALPLIAGMYMVFTTDSALQHWRGRGGAWKGRFQAAESRGAHNR